MKCKRKKNFARIKKIDRKFKCPKQINWFRAFMLMPPWDRLEVGMKKLEDC